MEVRIGGYLFRIPRVSGRVLVEAPPGLQRFLPRIARLLEEGGAEPIVRVEPSFGACDVGCREALELECSSVIHVGHLPYPLWHPPCPVEVYYAPGEYVDADADSILRSVFEVIKSVRGVRRVCIGYSAQHTQLARRLASSLADAGFEVRCTHITGCYVAPLASRWCEVSLVVAGGSFHALGVCLAAWSLGSIRVVRVDPYTESVEDFDCTRVVAARLALLEELRGFVSELYLLDGAKWGQRRPWLVEPLARAARRIGVKARVAVASRLLPDDVYNLLPPSVRGSAALVACSCPRLAIEDTSGRPELPPVLTPWEARALIFGWKGYSFPW